MRSGNFGVGSWIERRARIAPGDVAVIAGGRRRTYGQLAERVRRLANALRGAGVRKGDRVAWVGPNHASFLELLFATGQAGAALAPVNHLLPADAVAQALAGVEPTVLVEHAVAPAVAPASVRARWTVGDELERLLTSSADDLVEETVGDDDLCLIPHTSGTTGAPKGVMLTNGNVAWNVVNLLSRVDFRADDVTVAIAPFFRTGGLGVNVLPTLFAGGAVAVPDDASADAVLALMERERVTVGFGNPDSLDALLRLPSFASADLSRLRFVITGGAPVPERLIRAWLARGVPLLQGYGLSEAAPVVSLLDPREALAKVGAAGKPVLFVDVRVVGDAGADVSPGDVGELLVRGPNVMPGYWRRPDATREVLGDDGWLRTGDAARLDADGTLWIVDRVAAAFRVKGRRVFPGDVERALLLHPSVADVAVLEAGDVVAALVVVAPGAELDADAVIAHCRAALSDEQVPERVVFVGAIPRNAVGKILRQALPALVAG